MIQMLVLLATLFAVCLLLSESTPPIRDLYRVQRKAKTIDRLLPQIQCECCDYPGCMPYATAIATGEADINRCSPGGNVTIRELARLLGREPKALTTDIGVIDSESVAFIIERDCIGCTKCIQACPVDAIIGTAKRMHSILPQFCTGCGLCLPPCPVDCIEMVRE